MDAATLAQAMGCSLATANKYVVACNAAMIQAGCTNLNRAAMWYAQLGHESGGMKWMKEIWGPTKAQRGYEGRRDLGNTQPGDGKKFMGHGPIQITGRHNHTKVSHWAFEKGYIRDRDLFVNRPDLLAGADYGFLGAVWYWTVARPTINSLCDRGDVRGVTRLINGGTNGLADREKRYARVRAMGNRILPSGGGAVPAPAVAVATGGSIPELALGATGGAVRHLQEWLNRTFPEYARIDLGPSRYGPQTAAVIAEFQKRVGIRGDGKNVGPQTSKALWTLGYRPEGYVAPAPPKPKGPPLEGDDMYIVTPMPTTDQEGNITQPKNQWPTVRVPMSFAPESGYLKVDHGGSGGWIHLARWWIRARNWSPNVPLHDPRDHPLGAKGSERFVGFGWETPPPAGADMIELVLSAPHGVHIQWWRTK